MVQGKPTASQPSEIPVPYYRSIHFQKTHGYELTIKFDEHEVKSSDYLKILGVTIENKLTFSEHISNICKKTSCEVVVFLRLRNLILWSAKL